MMLLPAQMFGGTQQLNAEKRDDDTKVPSVHVQPIPPAVETKVLLILPLAKVLQKYHA
jgi:hypothetical protein